jgi:alkylation response protein AidB-like acyl-CoA dehydrogenase
MTTVDSSLSAATVLDDARRIAGGLGDRSREIEAARRVPPDLLQELIAAGCFRMLLPTTHGGVGATFPEALELYETLATGDASTGWTVMIGATGWCDLAALPRATFDSLFPPSADVIVAGAIAPSGSTSPIDGGYELTGRWGFVSGCEHATCIFANAIEGMADGHPLMRVSVLDPTDVVIEDTWSVAGLRGTGSHHVSVRGVVVPPERTFVPLVDAPCVEVPIVHIPTPALFALGIAAVAIGTAQGALDEVVGLAQGKVPLLAPGPLATSPLFLHDLARAGAGLDAGRALLVDATGRLWEQAAAGADASIEDRARARAAAAWATDAALVATEFAYRAGGGGALYDDSLLQHRLRDVHAMTQHFLVRPDTFVTVGGILAGQGLAIPVF